MWTLESRVAEDSMEAARTMATQERARLMAELGVAEGGGGAGGDHRSRAEWLELLRRQEALHRLEMDRWHEVLSVAAELLKKVGLLDPRLKILRQESH